MFRATFQMAAPRPIANAAPPPGFGRMPPSAPGTYTIAWAKQEGGMLRFQTAFSADVYAMCHMAYEILESTGVVLFSWAIWPDRGGSESATAIVRNSEVQANWEAAQELRWETRRRPGQGQALD